MLQKNIYEKIHTPHPETVGGLEAVMKASTWQDISKCLGGHNGAAIQARIDYMRRAINVGLVEAGYITRAIKTIENMEDQLCAAP